MGQRQTMRWSLTLCISLATSITSEPVSLSSFTVQTSIKGPTLIDEFLSFTIDAWFAINWNGLQPFFSSTSVNTLAKGLSPAYFRYGGTNEDSVIYNTSNENHDKDGTVAELLPTNLSFLNLTEFMQLINFSKNNNLKFIFGHMLQYRYDNNTFDPTNSANLFNLLKQHNIQSDFYSFELGNEPDVYTDSYGKQNNYQIISPQQNARDMFTFYDVLKNEFGFNNIEIWSCDNTHGGLSSYLLPYLETINKSENIHYLDKITWHHYYGDGNNWNVNDYINVNTLDSFIPSLNASINARNTYMTNTPILLGETGAGYGTNTNPLGSSFIAGFMWLDKLGLSSIGGLEAVCRQKLWSGYDSLLDQEFKPNPDYWSSYLFKGLVGNKALYVNNEYMYGRTVRVYAFCTRNGKNKINQNINYNLGDITILLLNINHDSVSINLILEPLNPNTETMSYDKYLLTGNPSSTEISLNGKVIEMMNATSLPILSPNNENYGTNFTMEGLSYGFVVIKNANASACFS